jgi:hypothetical protein
VDREPCRQSQEAHPILLATNAVWAARASCVSENAFQHQESG